MPCPLQLSCKHFTRSLLNFSLPDSVGGEELTVELHRQNGCPQVPRGAFEEEAERCRSLPSASSLLGG
jgi:hypothetical protein